MTDEKIEAIGKYKIIGLIGRGGMATVYKALHPELNRVVALKVLNQAWVHSPEMLARFRREARAIAALRHPNIVQVFDLDVVDGVYFMVMEYIEGETLSQRLTRLARRREPMPLNDMLRVIAAVGEALDYAHEQGMLHRDIKPANIMFRSDGSTVLTDFGVAKILHASSDITASGAVAGTPAYMAPEQWTDDGPDRRSDIYSLGVVLFQLVTGRLPFDAETPGRLMYEHLSAPPPLPRKLHANIPLDLERIILRALAKDPQDRYQTARELVEEIRGVIYQIESTAPTGFFRKLIRGEDGDGEGGRQRLEFPGDGSKRRRLAVLLGVGLLAVLIAAAGLFAGDLVASSGVESTPNPTLTAMAARLAALEATLSVTLTPAPTSSATPAAPTATPDVSATAAPSPLPSPSRSPSPWPTAETCIPSMALLQDVNYSGFDWWGTVNAPFEKVWRVRNDGDCTWPEGVHLVHQDGEAFGLEEPFPMSPLKVGAQTALSVTLRVPDAPGEYRGRFRLQTSDEVPLGEGLTVALEARPPTTPTPTTSTGALEPLQVAGFDLVNWSENTAENVWYGTVRLWARGGTGQYLWYRDTLDNPLPGDTLEFEWRICRDYFGTVWVKSGDAVDHEGLYVPYPGDCE